MGTERARVLATDDRPEILRLIERALGDRYECEFAGNCTTARAKLAVESFDLALCDIQMPGESGLDLAEEIAAEHPGTAVVLVTGEDDPEVAERAFDFGAHGYLVKPFWPGQLLITAMSALRRRQLEVEQAAHKRVLEERVQALTDHAPVPIYLKGADLRYTVANRALHELLGLEPGTMIGRQASEVMPDETVRRVDSTDHAILSGGGASEIEETLLVGDGKRVFRTVKFPYFDEGGGVAGIYGISDDITDRRRAEALREELTLAQQHAIEELRASRLETVDRLTRAIERHDAGTGEHVTRMAAVAALLGGRCGLDAAEVQLLRAAAPMHDVGKVATPDAILRKEGPLDPAERTEMERHATIGYEILSGSDSDLLQLAATIAHTHHERWDGSGYPRGIKGEEIPLEGRIVAVADVFDALLSDRSYRPALPVEEAVEIIRDGSGSHFDPVLVAILVENLSEALAFRV